MHKKYNGFYIGYVVQNNDPDRGGKVKIFVPAIMPTLGGISSEINADNAGVQIDFSDLSTISPAVLAQIKNTLPWARQVSPLIGSGSPTIFNARNHTTSPVDDPFWRQWYADLKKLGGRSDSPRRPGALSQLLQFLIKGAFGSKTTTDAVFGKIPENPVVDTNNTFSSGIKSNMAKGAFSIPGVGAVVWMFFENGEWDLPVYFGYQHATSAWREIFNANSEGQQGSNYPSGYENNPSPGTQSAETSAEEETTDGFDPDAPAVAPGEAEPKIPEGGGRTPEASETSKDQFLPEWDSTETPDSYYLGGGLWPKTLLPPEAPVPPTAPPSSPAPTAPPGQRSSTAPRFNDSAPSFNQPAPGVPTNRTRSLQVPSGKPEIDYADPPPPSAPTPTVPTIKKLSPQLPLQKPPRREGGAAGIG